MQATMVTVGLAKGERLTAMQWTGLILSLLGLAALVAPGVSAPSVTGAILMLGAGIAWGTYSLLGQAVTSPLEATTGNFIRAVPMAIAVAAIAALFLGPHVNASGLMYAVLSGAIATGLGYTIWYTALPGLSSAQGASVQLIVPVIAATAGMMLIGEPLTIRLLLSSVAILGGIALVIANRRVKR